MFLHDYEKSEITKNWCSDVKEIFSVIGLRNNFDRKQMVDIDHAKTLIHNYYAVKWANDIQNLPKLRTYRLFKTEFKCEQYVLLNLRKILM